MPFLAGHTPCYTHWRHSLLSGASSPVLQQLRGGAHVFPAEHRLAAVAQDVAHGVQSGDEDPVLAGPEGDVDPESKRLGGSQIFLKHRREPFKYLKIPQTW